MVVAAAVVGGEAVVLLAVVVVPVVVGEAETLFELLCGGFDSGSRVDGDYYYCYGGI